MDSALEEGDTVPVVVKEHQEVEGRCSHWLFFSFLSFSDKLRCGGAGLGGWGSPRARQGRKDHTVPLDLEQKMVCGVG